MAELPFGVDPAPHEDLPSDIQFTAWLADLTEEKVRLDEEARLNKFERSWVTYLRKKEAA